MSKTTCVVIAVVTLILVLVCALGCVGIAVASYYGLELGGRAEVEEAIASEMRVEPSATLRVRNPRGNVTIHTDGAGEIVQVEATKEAHSIFYSWAEGLLDEVEVEIEGEGSEGRVEVALPPESGIGIQFVRVNLVITVPQQIDLDVFNEAGHVQVKGTEGSIRVRSATGNVHVEEVSVTGGCDVMNTDGDIFFQGELPEPGVIGEGWEVLLRTETGDIDFRVPAESHFTVDAEAETGQIHSNFEVEDPESGKVDGNAGQWLRGSVNGSQASPNVILRTEKGNIRLWPTS